MRSHTRLGLAAAGLALPLALTGAPAMAATAPSPAVAGQAEVQGGIGFKVLYGKAHCAKVTVTIIRLKHHHHGWGHKPKKLLPYKITVNGRTVATGRVYAAAKPGVAVRRTVRIPHRRTSVLDTLLYVHGHKISLGKAKRYGKHCHRPKPVCRTVGGAAC
ncbi:hypothetical protein [Actinomadura yumaensis]|uniref:Uncharacterized protein n=1 Tax=Actinomadura yumaensis TaxID=111807 RepID=A0ABW2CDP5_9ACTN